MQLQLQEQILSGRSSCRRIFPRIFCLKMLNKLLELEKEDRIFKEGEEYALKSGTTEYLTPIAQIIISKLLDCLPMFDHMPGHTDSSISFSKLRNLIGAAHEFLDIFKS